MANGIPAELDLIGEINEQIHDSQSESAARVAIWQILRAMWEHREIAEASQQVYADRLRNSLPGLPLRDSQGGWFMGSWRSKDQRLRRLWQAFYSAPFQEAQNVQRQLLELIGQIQCDETMGTRVATGVKKRVDRLKGLGNAIVPQAAFEIIRVIAENEIPISLGPAA